MVLNKFKICIIFIILASFLTVNITPMIRGDINFKQTNSLNPILNIDYLSTASVYPGDTVKKDAMIKNIEHILNLFKTI